MRRSSSGGGPTVERRCRPRARRRSSERFGPDCEACTRAGRAGRGMYDAGGRSSGTVGRDPERQAQCGDASNEFRVEVRSAPDSVSRSRRRVRGRRFDGWPRRRTCSMLEAERGLVASSRGRLRCRDECGSLEPSVWRSVASLPSSLPRPPGSVRRASRSRRSSSRESATTRPPTSRSRRPSTPPRSGRSASSARTTSALPKASASTPRSARPQPASPAPATRSTATARTSAPPA